MARLSNEEKDTRLIEANPDASPKELLALGLSEAGFEKLAAAQPKEVKPQPQAQPEQITAEKPEPAQPTVLKNGPAVPKLQAAPEGSQYTGDMVVLINPTTGTRTPMPRTTANRFKRGGRNADFIIEG